MIYIGFEFMRPTFVGGMDATKLKISVNAIGSEIVSQTYISRIQTNY